MLVIFYIRLKLQTGVVGIVNKLIVSYHTNKLRNDGIDGFITKDITM